MNITQELYDQLTKLDFIIEQKKINQAEGLFLIVEVYFASEYWKFRIPNNPKTNLKHVIDRLVEESLERGLEQGIKKGKREVGDYLQNLTQL